MHNARLTLSKYIAFTTMFVVSALALNRDEDTTTDIAEIDEWMTNNVPLEILEPHDLPPRTDEEFGVPPVAWRVPGHTVVTTDGWTSPALDPSMPRETIHILSVPASSSSPSIAEGSTSHAPVSASGASTSTSHAPVSASGASTSTSRAPVPASGASTTTRAINGAPTSFTGMPMANDDGTYNSDLSMPGLKTPSDGSDDGY